MPMTITFTKNDVVRELYAETSAQENENLHIAQLYDSSLKEEMDNMRDLKKALDHALLQPPKRVTEAILKAARW